MCGITGFFALAGSPMGTPTVLDRMCTVMTHRGPDDQGTWVEGPVGLGMRRLSVIDLSGGKQPASSEDAAIRLVFNGEIYNHGEIRAGLAARGHVLASKSDTEILPHLYEERGLDFLDSLVGMFAIALYDAPRGRLVLARDRMGEKPLYYTRVGDELVFGSEMKCLLAHPGVARRLSLPALSRYLLYEYVPAPHAILEGVHKLPPGHMLIAEDGQIRVMPYWAIDPRPASPELGEDEAARQLATLLDTAVRAQLEADVPVGIFLSGGIDSSTVAALAARARPGAIETFSIGFDDPSFDESSHARVVAKHLKTKHHERIFAPKTLVELLPGLQQLLDEPFGDASILPTYCLSRFAREHVTVALGGDGGDELFAGYPTYQAQKLAQLFDALPGGLGRALAGTGRAVARLLPVNPNNLSFDFKVKRFTGALEAPVIERHARWLGSFGPDDQKSLLSADVRAALAGDDPFDVARGIYASSAGAPPLSRLLALDGRTYLPDDILFKVDRASMATSLEVRAPLLDHRVVAFASALPPHLKLKGLRTKHLLKRVAADLIPRAILERPKKGFGMPVAKWLKAELREPMLDLLSAERLRRAGLFDPVAVDRLVKEHLDGRHDHRKLLWTLLMFEGWWEAYMVAPVGASR